MSSNFPDRENSGTGFKSVAESGAAEGSQPGIRRDPALEKVSICKEKSCGPLHSLSKVEENSVISDENASEDAHKLNLTQVDNL